MSDKTHQPAAFTETMHHVIALEDDYWVHDFTRGYDEDFVCPYRHSIGRYDEIRPGMYTHEIFEGKRDLHIGIDIGAPVGEEIHAFSNCVVHSKGMVHTAPLLSPNTILRVRICGPSMVIFRLRV